MLRAILILELSKKINTFSKICAHLRADSARQKQMTNSKAHFNHRDSLILVHQYGISLFDYNKNKTKLLTKYPENKIPHAFGCAVTIVHKNIVFCGSSDNAFDHQMSVLIYNLKSGMWTNSELVNFF